MDRRSLLQSLLAAPFACLRGLRVPGELPSAASPDARLAPLPAAEAFAWKPGHLPEVEWGSLSQEEQRVLVTATTLESGHAGVVFPCDFPNHPYWSEDRSRRTRTAARNHLFRLGLLTYTSKTPEHSGDLCGWYTITHYGRWIIPAKAREQILRELSQEEAEHLARLAKDGVLVSFS